MGRNLGRMGESAFVNLCDVVDITASKPSEDRYGWDYLLEFPDENYSDVSIDKHSSSIECKVQIKSTDKSDFKLPLKLSVMNRLVKAQMPTFICFLHFNKTNKIEELYLVHIDKNIMSEVLKKLRMTEITNKKLNKTTITIKYSNNDKLEEISGKALKSKIHEYIPNGMNDYVNQKNKYLKNLGFEEDRGTFKFTTDDVKVDDLVDAFLGLKKGIPVNIEKFAEKRFGIELPIKDNLSNFKNVKMSFEPEPIKDIELSIKKTSFSRPEAVYILKLYTAPFAIVDKFKVLVKNDFFTIIFEHSMINFSFNFMPEKRFILFELINLLTLPSLLSNDNKQSYIIELKDKSKVVFQQKISSIDNDKMSFIKNIYYGAKKLQKLFNTLEINLDFSISLKEIEENVVNLDYLELLLSDNFETMRIESVLEQENIIIDEERIIKSVLPVPFIFDEKVLFIIFVFTCKKIDNQEKPIILQPFSREVFDKVEIGVNEYNRNKFFEYLDEISKKIGNDEEYVIYVDSLIPFNRA